MGVQRLQQAFPVSEEKTVIKKKSASTSYIKDKINEIMLKALMIYGHLT